MRRRRRSGCELESGKQFRTADWHVIRLSGDAEDARRLVEGLDVAYVDVLDAEAALRPRRVHGLRQRRWVLAVEDAEDDDVGFASVLALVILGRPSAVATIKESQVRIERPTAFMRRNAVLGVKQVAFAVAALIAQTTLALLPQPAPVGKPSGRHMRSVLFVRTLVGRQSQSGGSVSHAAGVISGFQDHGVNVRLVTTDPGIGNALDTLAWGLHPVPRGLRFTPSAMAFAGDVILSRYAREASQCDVIYHRYTRFSVIGTILSQLARRPLVLEYNSSGPDRMTGMVNRLQSALEHRVLRSATVISVVSEIAARQLAARGHDSSRILVNPNGVRRDDFRSNRGGETRTAIGIPDGRYVFGFLGTFGFWHGAEILAKAFVELSRGHSEIHLLLVGDGERFRETSRIIDAADLSDHLTAIGLIPRDQVPHVLAATDCLISPHVPWKGGVEFFGSPTKLFEYMASGKPIVASNLGQLADVITHEQNGLLVEPASVSDLAAAMSRLILDRHLGERLAAQALEDVAEYSWTANAWRIIERVNAGNKLK